MLYGISGIRITSAVPASPLCSAMNPASRPITSSTITRSWLSAVVCSLSIASIAVFTAVSKPKVVIVQAHIVVDRLRHADDLHALLEELLRDASEPSPPIVRIASMPSSFARSISSSERSISMMLPSGCRSGK